MFARAACGLAVWVGMTGAAAAQTYGSGFSGRGIDPLPLSGSPRPALFPRDVAPGARPAASAPVPTPPVRLAPPQPLPDSAPLPAPAPARPVQPAAARADVTPPPMPTPAELGFVPRTEMGGPGCDFGCDDVCGPPGRCWVGFEWLYWVTSGQGTPALVTTAPVGTPRAVAGVLGQPTTATLFGGNRVNSDFRNGFRVTAGTWLNDAQTFGLEGNFFFLARSRQQFAAASDGSQVITRPFINALSGTGDTELVSFPGVVAGRVRADPRNTLLGAGANAIANLFCDPCGRLDFLIGYRYLNLVDRLTAEENLTALAGQTAAPAGTQYTILDQFTTRNNFHGGLLGLGGEWRFGHFYLGGRTGVSLGVNRQTTSIDGTTVLTPPGGAPQAFSGGLLAQPSNIGHTERSVFAVMPEVNLRFGVQVTEMARAFVGYDFLYLSNVLRAGDQIDPRVNPNFLPPRAIPVAGPAVPAYSPRTTDFWAQGVSVGLELRF